MIYDHPQYYDVAFSFRNVPQEAAFLHACIDRFSDVKVKWTFEIACGSAPHAGELISRGYHYMGIDNNRNMLDYATYKWRGLKPPPEFLKADMVWFECPRRVDFVYVMLGSLYLNSIEEMTKHFDSVARCLRPGGLYFLDWCVQFTDPLSNGPSNVISNERDGIKVESKFNIRLIDAAKQIYEETWALDVDDHGHRRQLQMTELNRAIFPEEFRLFIKSRSDFELAGWWKDWDLDRPVEGPGEIGRPVVILKRK